MKLGMIEQRQFDFIESSFKQLSIFINKVINYKNFM